MPMKFPKKHAVHSINGGTINWHHKQMRPHKSYYHLSIRRRVQLICRPQRPIFNCSAIVICMRAGNHCWRITKPIYINLSNTITTISLCIRHCKPYTRSIQIKRLACEPVSIRKWNCQSCNAGSKRIRIHHGNRFSRMCCN